MNNPKTDKERIADLYHRVSSFYGRVGPDPFSTVGQFMVEQIGITAGARVLDVAAGRGANLFAAAQKVGSQGQVTGIDIAEGMVQETTNEIKQRNLSQATMRQMDAEHLDFPDGSFDYVLCGFAIFLFPHLEQALAEFLRVLRPGGKLGIAVAYTPGPLSLWYGERLHVYYQRYRFPLKASSGEGVNYAKLPQYLTEAGFASVQETSKELDIVYADAQEWWDALWTHGTRYALEHMEPQILAQFKAEVFLRLTQETQADGIHDIWRALLFIASK